MPARRLLALVAALFLVSGLAACSGCSGGGGTSGSSGMCKGTIFKF